MPEDKCDAPESTVVWVGRGGSRRQQEIQLGPVAKRCWGRRWSDIHANGTLGLLLGEFNHDASVMRQAMGWPTNGHLSKAIRNLPETNELTVVGELPASQDSADPKLVNETGLKTPLANQLLAFVRREARGVSISELSDRFDRSPRSVRDALAEIKAAAYEVDVDDERDTASIHTSSVSAVPRCGELPGWGEHSIRFCAMGDTHLENRCAARDELNAVYDRCVEEGIDTVLHGGNLSDGPGNMGYRSHYLEVEDGCQDIYGCLKFLYENYPQRDGVKTYHISSSTCHEGWAFQHRGVNMGAALSKGCTFTMYGENGDEEVVIPPRPDLIYLGMDEYTILCGPEGNTRLRLFHPGGGSSYASSYKSQKWVESLQGGTKPHLAVIAHFHKSNYFTPRDVRVLSPGCLEWQTGFMRKLMIEAQVAAWFVEMWVDGDGSLRRVRLEEMPFYFEPKRYYQLGA